MLLDHLDMPHKYTYEAFLKYKWLMRYDILSALALLKAEKSVLWLAWKLFLFHMKLITRWKFDRDLLSIM